MEEKVVLSYFHQSSTLDKVNFAVQRTHRSCLLLLINIASFLGFPFVPHGGLTGSAIGVLQLSWGVFGGHCDNTFSLNRDWNEESERKQKRTTELERMDRRECGDPTRRVFHAQARDPLPPCTNK
jgi:hypothetical protein